MTKLLPLSSLNVNHIKRSWIFLSVDNNTNSSQVSILSHHTQVSSVSFDEVSYLACLQIRLNGIIQLDKVVKVANGLNIMGHQIWNYFCAHKDLSYFEKLALCLLKYNMMNSKVPLGVIDPTEVLSSLVNAHDI